MIQKKMISTVCMSTMKPDYFESIFKGYLMSYIGNLINLNDMFLFILDLQFRFDMINFTIE